MKRTISLILLGLALAATQVCAQSEKDAFVGADKKTIKKQYKYLAFAPVDAAAALNMPDGIRQMIEAEVTKRLEKKKFKLLPPSAMQEIRDNMTALVGGTTKGGNDEPDVARLAVVRDHSYRELLYRYPVDGLVSVKVSIVGAPFANDRAEWLGVNQKVKAKGGGFAKLVGGGKYQGTIAASALKITIWDRSENILYSWDGGIEVLMHREKKQLLPLPESDFWQDEKRVKKAVELALKPL